MKKIQKLIESKVADITVDLEAEISTGEKAKDIFCTYSPAVEVVFEAAAVAIKNPIAKWVLVLALAIINNAQEKFCPEEPTTED